MAIDYDAVFETLHDIQSKVDEMVIVVNLVNNGGHNIPVLGFTSFTAAQINELKVNYQTKKTELALLYQDLP